MRRCAHAVEAALVRDDTPRFFALTAQAPLLNQGAIHFTGKMAGVTQAVSGGVEIRSAVNTNVNSLTHTPPL